MTTPVDNFNCLFLLTNPDTTLNWSSASKMLGQFFFLVFGFIIIIALIAYSLRIASKFKGVSGLNNNMRVIESRALGFNNYIHLVKAGDKYFLLGSSKTNVAFLSELDKNEITDFYENPRSMNFSEILNKGISKFVTNKKDDTKDEECENGSNNRQK